MQENSHNDIDPSESPSPGWDGALYALGTMSAAERAEFEAHLAADTGAIAPDDIEEHLRTMAELAEEIASVMPAPRRAVKDAIMAAIDASEPAVPDPKQIVVRANQGEWIELMPGISVKVLFYNEELQRTTLLVRLQPGAAYPMHRHVGVEECLVLEGDLHVNGTILYPGDYAASLSEKIHRDTHSDGGCLLLINSPLDDEYLDPQDAGEHR